SLNSDQIKQVVIAYEPVWAIGTGETATPQQAQEMHAFIRTCMKDLFDSSVSDNCIVLYGGSCNASNAKDLFSCEDIDGGLIGGASLKAEDFCKIIASA
ncbi:MAG TPA: triose-phosphate isomerase, partial [Bacteroidia bacterium]|nr:triose-phosphate isomerase [Bacteroidia bacterium]